MSSISFALVGHGDLINSFTNCTLIYCKHKGYDYLNFVFDFLNF